MNRSEHIEGAKKTSAVVVVLLFLLVTLLCVVAAAFGVVFVMERGPSPTATVKFCQSVRETSAIRWLAGIFLSDEELADILETSTGKR